MSPAPTHRYTGPTNKYGLGTGAPCTIVGRRAGGIVIRLVDGRTFIVGRHQAQRLEAPR